MFQDLLKLYKNNPNKTPLEDFNTECFSGILYLFPEVLKAFTLKFLELPDDKYQVITQLRQYIEDDPNCIIDFVLKGEKNICFIENKIGSKEGHHQLERYGKALDKHYPDYKKYLFYCTKDSEPKNENGEFDDYHFKQFKWYEIAKFLKQFNKNPLIINYIELLKTHKMEQDNTFKINNLLALENLNKSLEIAEFHVNNAREEFDKIFHSEKTSSNKFIIDEIKSFKRVCHYGEEVLKSDNKYSDVLYAIQFDTLELDVQIFVDSEHEQHEKFREINLTGTNFQKEKWDDGTTIYKRKPLGDFLNDENSDKSIKEWFTKSFDKLLELIKSNPQLKWNIK